MEQSDLYNLVQKLMEQNDALINRVDKLEKLEKDKDLVSNIDQSRDIIAEVDRHAHTQNDVSAPPSSNYDLTSSVQA